ncbi:MAG: VCBS repeat-containing protein [Acidobacteria bacterium]|nr:VCBS repeat-containing protein [Acidobacteriota bacterium]
MFGSAAAARGAATFVLALAFVATAHAVSFAPPVTSDVAGPGIGDRLAIGDPNEDCQLDAVATRDFTTTAEDQSLNLLLGDGSGGFPDSGGMDGGESVSDVLLVDLDGDGHLDLLTSESFDLQGVPYGICARTSPSVLVFLGDGLGGFVHRDCLAAKDHPSTIAAADFDGDGSTDLLVGNTPSAGGSATSPDALFFSGRGDGTFVAPIVSFRQRADDFAVADLNGDGRPDLAVAGRTGAFVLLGRGDGRFVLSGAGIGTTARRVALGDINGDGAPDLAAVGSVDYAPGDDLVWISFNDGAGAFTAGTSYVTGSHPVDVAVGDFDGDGRGDVVVANNKADNVWFYRAGPAGVLETPQPFAAGLDPMSLALIDANRDGALDIVVGNRNLDPDGTLADGSVSTLLQQVAAPLEVATASLACGEPNARYHQCLEARGGTPPYDWSIASGALPGGLVLDPATGRISGSPVANGTSEFTVEATDSLAAAASRALALATDSDGDDDGQSTCEGDCDDLDPARRAGNEEVCDNKDNDCDLVVDAGRDADADGADDLCDNCPALANPDQRDRDKDGAGNLCDTDPFLLVSSDPVDNPAFATVQEAIDAATESGTTIRVRPGTGAYNENVIIDRSMVFTLEGDGATVIDGGAGAAVTVLSLAGARSFEIRGVTLRGQNGLRARVDTRVVDCTFESIAGNGLELERGTHEGTGLVMGPTVAGGASVHAPAGLQLVSSRMNGLGQHGIKVAGRATLHTVLIAQGGGAAVQVIPGAALNLRHATIADNAGPGLEATGASIYVASSILHGNGGGDVVGGACSDISWSHVGTPDCAGTNSNMTGDPMFAAGYKLDAASGCLDHGPDPAQYIGTPCFDLDGGPRLRDHDGDGLAEWDVGAFERTNPGLLPPDVTGLAWSSATLLGWEAEPSAVEYHVYRGALDGLSYANYGACRDGFDANRSDTLFLDAEVPAAGQGLFYVVTAEDASAAESSLGLGTCAERGNFAACP